jgi:hypothetical protein
MRMSENEVTKAAGLTTEQLEKIGGGTCSPDQVFVIIQNLTDAYEGLVGFVSHVIERVGGAP